MANKPESRLTDQQRFDWLRLTRSENVGPRTFRALITNCGGVASGAEGAAGARAARRREAPDPHRFGRRGRKRAHRRSQTRGPLRRARRAGLSAGAAGDRFRAADSRSSGPRGSVAQGGGRDRRLPQRFRCGTRRSPSGWRAAWDKPATSSSLGWRGGSTSAPMSRAWRPAPSGCSLGDMESPIRARLCR